MHSVTAETSISIRHIPRESLSMEPTTACTTPLISVIVPVYNVAAYLPGCLDSILAQSHTNIEIIVIDDGSTDESGQICDDYALKDSRIRVIHKANGGLSDARNAGMYIMTGDYVSFVDSDDRVAPDFLATLLSAMKTHNAEIGECQIKKVYDINQFPCAATFDGESKVHDTEAALEELIRERAFHQTVWNKLYRRKTIGEVRFPAGKINEDEFWTYRVFAQARQLVSVPYAGYFYFQRSGSIINSQYNVRRFSGMEALWERLDFIAERFPALYALAEQQAFGAVLSHYQRLLSQVPKPERINPCIRIRRWVRSHAFSLSRNPFMGKYILFLGAFLVAPNLFSKLLLRKYADQKNTK